MLRFKKNLSPASLLLNCVNSANYFSSLCLGFLSFKKVITAAPLQKVRIKWDNTKSVPKKEPTSSVNVHSHNYWYCYCLNHLSHSHCLLSIQLRGPWPKLMLFGLLSASSLQLKYSLYPSSFFTLWCRSITSKEKSEYISPLFRILQWFSIVCRENPNSTILHSKLTFPISFVVLPSKHLYSTQTGQTSHSFLLAFCSL